MTSETAQNGTKFKWTGAKELAVQLVAEGKLNEDAICAKVSISRRQLARWKSEPEFISRKKELVAEHADLMDSRFLGRKAGRLETLYRAVEAIETILVERGADLKDIAGGGTGYIARDYKGKDADVPVYAFDAALMREYRALLEQIADERGQLVKRSEITGKDGGSISLTITADDERL